jgi:hypothetical protein
MLVGVVDAFTASSVTVVTAGAAAELRLLAEITVLIDKTLTQELAVS